MVIKRRKRIGKPLLTATAATTVTLTSCIPIITGNPVPTPYPDDPVSLLDPLALLCIDVTPDDAEVTVFQNYDLDNLLAGTDGGNIQYSDVSALPYGIRIEDRGCTNVDSSEVLISAKADGFEDFLSEYQIVIGLDEPRTDVKIDMVPINPSDAGTSNTDMSDAGTNDPSDAGE
ncbi:MAG: hypothetical protein CMH56_07900 [Myxococcales bacterium]|nr:hypothetical protein [Myxococcales bacterium]|tara:strand:- start:208 stop:729 length:522 start_codon:yes stop_codon:yes gene_type:complete